MKILRILNKFYNRFFSIYSRLVSFLVTILVVLFAKSRGIILGKGNIFYGFTKFVLNNNSEIKIGNNCRFRSRTTSNLIGINHKCIISTHKAKSKIIIGDRCGFSGTTIGSFNLITIGNNVMCGANTLITDSDWHNDDNRVNEPKSVNIGDNVWLGYNVIVLKGVSIGSNTIIGAGSVVTKSIPANVIAGGNPCKILKSI